MYNFIVFFRFTITSDVEAYNINTKQWRKVNKLNRPRYSIALEVLHGKLTAIGGIANEKGSMEEFDGVNWKKVETTLNREFWYGPSVVLPCGQAEKVILIN